MGEFVCRVADANGRVFSQVEAAGTHDEARQKMADRGLYVYSVQPRNSLVSGIFGRNRIPDPMMYQVLSSPLLKAP